MLNNCIGYSKEPRFSSAIGICEMSLFAWYYRWLMIGVLFLSPELALAQMSIEDRLAPGQPPVIIVHRAAVGGAPDNSLAGIQNAIDRGIDMVEIDIQITLDGQYIVMHDPVLTTTTNVEDVFPDGSPHRIPHKAGRPHYVEDYTLKEIQQLRLLDEQGGDHPVPSLDEVLHLVDGKLLVIMELKNWEKESLAQLLEDHETDNLLLFQQTDMSKFQDIVVATGIKAFASLARWADVAELEKLFSTFGPKLAMVGVTRKRLKPEFVSKAEELEIPLSINGLSDEDISLLRGDPLPWKAALDSGAAAFMTHYPEALLKMLGR